MSFQFEVNSLPTRESDCRIWRHSRPRQKRNYCSSPFLIPANEDPELVPQDFQYSSFVQTSQPLEFQAYAYFFHTTNSSNVELTVAGAAFEWMRNKHLWFANPEFFILTEKGKRTNFSVIAYINPWNLLLVGTTAGYGGRNCPRSRPTLL